jgi:hypothetical protein
VLDRVKLRSIRSVITRHKQENQAQRKHTESTMLFFVGILIFVAVIGVLRAPLPFPAQRTTSSAYEIGSRDADL